MNTMPTITAVIVDDEANARLLLREMLKIACPAVQILAECPDLPQGVIAIRKLKPQIVFLDIEMPGQNGLQIMDFFGESEVDFSIIFVTAYHAYAIQAFKLNAVDYLLKPVQIQELEDAMARWIKRSGQSNVPQVRQALLPSPQRKIAVPSGNTIRFLDPAQVVFLKADNTYTEIMLLDGSKLVVSRTLKNFEEALQDHGSFIRCHKSYIVNAAHVRQLNKADGGSLLMQGNVDIPITLDRVQDLMDQMSMIRR